MGFFFPKLVTPIRRKCASTVVLGSKQQIPGIRTWQGWPSAYLRRSVSVIAADSRSARRMPPDRARAAARAAGAPRARGPGSPRRRPGAPPGSSVAPFLDVLFAKGFAYRYLDPLPILFPGVGVHLCEGQALRHAHLEPIEEQHLEVTGADPQLGIDAAGVSRRVLVLADRAADAEVHPVPGDRSRALNREERALAVLHLAEDPLGFLIRGNEALSSFGEPELHDFHHPPFHMTGAGLLFG